MDQIAVFKRDEKMEAFLHCNRVEIYEKQDETWLLVKTVSFPPVKGNTVKELRQETENIAVYAEDAKAILCKEITGIPFSVFDKKGYGIFCTEEAGEETFEGVITELKESDEKKRMKEEMIRNARPVETGTPGIYHLNLLDLQKECPEVSSKKALVSFLKQTPFLELHLICAHIPPWLEHDSTLEKKVRLQDGVSYVTITKKQC
ncbi:Fe-only nitrogenase accessory AnfO family protein [Lacrimispora sp. JR3]|uniref:Fe-only nitrogenase accessory AnfO family protein n=1 Tax=Lacrimispora sinapis TaxID=3111456 RepID=UPI00374A30C5